MMESRGLCISIQRFASQQEVVQYRAKQDGHFLRKHVTWLQVDSSKKRPRLPNQKWEIVGCVFSKQSLYIDVKVSVCVHSHPLPPKHRVFELMFRSAEAVPFIW